MNYKLEGRDILSNNEQLGPYPDHLLKRVNVPTNWIPGNQPKRKSHHDAAKGASGLSAKGNFKQGRTEPLFKSVLQARQPLKKNNLEPNPVAEKQAPIPDDPRIRSRHLKSVCYMLGADAVGICEVPEYAMYLEKQNSDEPVNCDWKYAIVIAKRKDARTCSASNGYDWIMNCTNHVAYTMLYNISEALANYMRRLGFDAYTSNANNYVTVMTSLLIASGIGECGRMGIAVNPFFGGGIKSCAVLTNMELEIDKPIDFGLMEYCKTCGICSEVCLSKAISPENDLVEYNGYKKYKMEYSRCAALQSSLTTGGACARCANFCPWNRPDIGPEFYKDWDGDLKKLYESVDARAAYLRERNFVTEEHENRRWWFDLAENEEGELVIPSQTKYTEY